MRRPTEGRAWLTSMIMAGLALSCGNPRPIGLPVKLLADSYSEARIRVSGPQEASRRAPVGKIRLGGEAREAIYLDAGTTVRWRIRRAGVERRLSYGFARPANSEAGAALRIVAGTGAGQRRVLEVEGLEGAGRAEWQDREVTVPPCASGPCWIGVTVSGGGASEAPSGLYVSNPLLAGDVRPAVPNIILISLDTLGADHLPAYGGPAGISPYVDQLVAEGVLFENAFANSSVTHTSHASILGGSSPFNSEYLWLDGSVEDEVTLADALRAGGYVTGAFTGGVILSEQLGFDRGFETFYQHDTLFRGPGGRTDIEELTARALTWVRRHEDLPFFLFLHSYEVHGPFLEDPEAPASSDDTAEGKVPDYLNLVHMRGQLPAPAERLPRLVTTLSPQGREVSLLSAGLALEGASVARQAYRNEIRYADRVVGRFLDALDDEGLLEDTLLVLTSDHGEAFFEHGLVQHGLLYGENLRIPIVVRYPGRLRERARLTPQVSSMDIAPTILDLVGLPIPEEMDGRTLVPMIDGDDVADRSLYGFVIGNGLFWQTEQRQKLVVRAALGQPNYGKVELYDLISDPSEQRDDSAARGIPPALAQWMWQTIEAMPGIHIDFGSLAGRTLDLELPTLPGYLDRIFAFEIERSGCVTDAEAEAMRCTLAFSEASRIVAVDRGRWKVLDLELHGAGGTLSYSIEALELTPEPAAIEAVQGGPPLVAWRASEYRPSQIDLSPEALDALRALGYIR